MLLAGCGGDRPEAAPFASRDSAGIEIVENGRPSSGPEDFLALSPQPTLVIGAGGGAEYDLSRVAGAARLADGRIVVGDGGSAQLRFYDSSGVFINAAGGRGGGPGELSAIGKLERLPGDTLVVMETHNTVSVFDSRGAFVRRLQLQALPHGLPGIAAVVMPLPGGSYLLASAGMTEARGSGDRWIDSMPVALLGRDSAVHLQPARFPAFEMVMGENGPRPPHFAATAVFASSPASFFWGIGREYTIREYSHAGQLRRMIRRRWTPPAITSAELDRYIAADERDDPHSETLPAFAQILVDREGRLWVREANAADANAAGQVVDALPLVPSVWNVFDGGGRWLGNVTMPARFTARDIGDDYVVGVARDALDVQTVAVYGLRSGGGDR